MFSEIVAVEVTQHRLCRCVNEYDESIGIEFYNAGCYPGKQQMKVIALRLKFDLLGMEIARSCSSQ